MAAEFQTQASPSRAQAGSPVLSTSGLLQRKCACGSAASPLTGECPECLSEKHLQRQLSVGASNDPLEHEADRVADQVLAMPAHATVHGASPRIQRLPGQSNSEMAAAPASVDRILASSGRPLEAVLQQDMEQRFGHDFSKVRVHSGEQAGHSAHEVNAKAYTVGHDIVFGAGQFAPATAEGRRLLAHELAHVVQQSGAAGKRIGRLSSSGIEPESHQRSGIVAQEMAGISRSAKLLARQPSETPEKPDANELARTLAKKLRDKKQDEVLASITGLAQTERDALDAAVAKILPQDQAALLHRAIRFVTHKPATMPNQNVVTVVDAGTSEAKLKGDKIAAGAVEFRSGVSYKSKAGDSKEAYSLTYKGSDAAEMRWLQFVWREIVPEFPASAKGGSPRKIPLRKRLDHGSNVYHLTTDRAKPSVSTDSSSGGSAFYEDNATVNRSAGELAMFDAPSSMQTDAAAFFTGAAGDPGHVISHFHASTYLIRGMDVLYRAEIDVSWDFTKDTLNTSPPAQVTAKKAAAGAIDPAHRARLLAQYPQVDYLPGPVIAAPQPAQEFDPVTDLAPAGSIQEKDWGNKTDLDRYEDIARLAHAEWIDDVTGISALGINNVGTSGVVKPGLNYSTKIPTEAETGYIDTKGDYHNPELPTDADGPLPRVAIILGPKAFKRDKAFALATLRHEMTHAAHNELAIGWLLKWRDERTGKSFKDWLSNEQKKKRISEVDFALVSTGVTLNLAATEVLAWTEGFVTALPFLPAKPEFRLMASGDYPAAIAGLKGAGKFYNSVSSKAVKQAALERIRTFSCATLNQNQRDALIAWIPFLLDPSSLEPTKDDAQTVTLINNEFPPLKTFLGQVLASVKKACTK